MEKLLTRDEFRDAVFKRDKHLCVICHASGQDAHHILERRLWPDGGYYLSNGATLCGLHHIQAETTELSVEQIREACGITKKIIPPHLYDDQIYDKWGNPILESGARVRGELFEDESVQKILAQGGVLSSFTSWVKYPRTYHLPWSGNVTDDDRVAHNLDHFLGTEIVVTEKMDGENSSLYNNYIHARSVDSRNHASRNWLKNFWSSIKSDIPEGYRVCGENLYAVHSLRYTLPTYFMGFSVWNYSMCLDWNDTQEWFELLGITSVPVLYRGIWNEKQLKELAESMDTSKKEGYVVRLASSFLYKDFNKSVAKFVRKNHVQTTKHWMHGQPIEKNILV